MVLFAQLLALVILPPNIFIYSPNSSPETETHAYIQVPAYWAATFGYSTELNPNFPNTIAICLLPSF